MKPEKPTADVTKNKNNNRQDFDNQRALFGKSAAHASFPNSLFSERTEREEICYDSVLELVAGVQKVERGKNRAIKLLAIKNKDKKTGFFALLFLCAPPHLNAWNKLLPLLQQPGEF